MGDIGSHLIEIYLVLNIFKLLSLNLHITTRNFTFSHKFFRHEYNFISKDDIGRQNLSLLRKFMLKF